VQKPVTPSTAPPSLRCAVALVVGLALLSWLGCAPAVGPGTYSVYDAGRPMSVEYGVVDAVRDVAIQGQPTGAGAAVGSTVGAMAGAAIGSNNSYYYNGSGAWWGGLAGALIGGLVGSAIEADAARQDGVELRVQMDSGKTLIVVQGNQEVFKPGDAVEVVTAPDGTARVQRTPH